MGCVYVCLYLRECSACTCAWCVVWCHRHTHVPSPSPPPHTHTNHAPMRPSPCSQQPRRRPWRRLRQRHSPAHGWPGRGWQETELCHGGDPGCRAVCALGAWVWGVPWCGGMEGWSLDCILCNDASHWGCVAPVSLYICHLMSPCSRGCVGSTAYARQRGISPIMCKCAHVLLFREQLTPHAVMASVSVKYSGADHQSIQPSLPAVLRSCPGAGGDGPGRAAQHAQHTGGGNKGCMTNDA